MGKALVLAVIASLAAVVGQGAATAGPLPKVSVTCTVGDTTVAEWQRVRVVDVELVWSGPAVYSSVSSPVAPKPPHGTLTAATPPGSTPPTSVTATLTPDGGGAPLVVTASCS